MVVQRGGCQRDRAGRGRQAALEAQPGTGEVRKRARSDVVEEDVLNIEEVRSCGAEQGLQDPPISWPELTKRTAELVLASSVSSRWAKRATAPPTRVQPVGDSVSGRGGEAKMDSPSAASYTGTANSIGRMS